MKDNRPDKDCVYCFASDSTRPYCPECNYLVRECPADGFDRPSKATCPQGHTYTYQCVSDEEWDNE